MPALAKRDKSIDFIKGIAIYLVVLAHCWLISSEIFNFIYSFHMPLFFCISGYLFSAKRKYKSFLFAKFKALIVPYILFFIFSFLVSVLLLNRNVTVLKGIEYLLLGGRYCALVCNWPLWYLPLFFIASNILYFIVKIKIPAVRYCILAALFFASLPVQNFFNTTCVNDFVPLALNALCPGLFFMLFTYEFKIIKNKLTPKINAKLKRIGTPIISTGLFILGLVLAAGNTDEIISVQSYAFLIYPLLIIQFIVLICMNCNNKFISYVGNNSLIILGAHRVLLFVFQEYIKIEKLLDYIHMSNFAGAVLVSGLCVVLICVTKELVCALIKACKKSLLHKKA